MSIRCGLFFAAGMIAVVLGRWLLGETRDTTAEVQKPSATVERPAAERPWGELEITPLVLERPDELFDGPDAPAPSLQWFFPNYSKEQAAAFLGSCDLTPGQRAALMNPQRWEALSDGCRLSPPLETVKTMNPATRERIYSLLAQSPKNVCQQLPFFYRAGGFEEWLAGCELERTRIDLVRQLCYSKSRRLYFADVQLFELLTSSNETRHLIKTLSRVPTLLMKLKVGPKSDIGGLLRYWGGLGRSNDVKYLLKSMSQVAGGATVNVSDFMPAFARLRLYTYPKPGAVGEDCFWTSFNFFSERPEYEPGPPDRFNPLLQSQYDPVRGDKRFGDLMFLLEGDGTAVHLCVYVADDVVYTKNGGSPNQPWVLMRLSDIMALYTSEKQMTWHIFRKKGV